MNQSLLEHFKPDLFLGAWGVVGKPIPFPFSPNAPCWVLHRWNDLLEKYILPRMLPLAWFPEPDLSNVEQRTEIITGADGNAILLHIAKPKNPQGRVPCVLYMHGGAMAIQTAMDPAYRNHRLLLATFGFAVVSVEFRNSSGKLGPHPYPAGLTDCMSALSWAHANREQLGVSKIIASGESGGGNLCLALAIRAAREGRLHELDGVYALSPFIAGPEIWSAKEEFQSLKECDEYFIDMKGFLALAKLYDPDLANTDDPCAWPLKARPKDLQGLPPHFINVDELDPLRDEGLAYAEKLRAAGVRVESRVALGTPHACDIICYPWAGCEQVFLNYIDAMRVFIESL